MFFYYYLPTSLAPKISVCIRKRPQSKKEIPHLAGRILVVCSDTDWVSIQQILHSLQQDEDVVSCHVLIPSDVDWLVVNDLL